MGDVFRVGFDEVGQLAQDPCAFARRLASPAPIAKGRPASADRTVDVVHSTGRHPRQDLAGRGVQDVDPLSAQGGNRPAIDEHLAIRDRLDGHRCPPCVLLVGQSSSVSFSRLRFGPLDECLRV